MVSCEGNSKLLYVTDLGEYPIPDDIMAKVRGMMAPLKTKNTNDRRTKAEKLLREWAKEQDRKAGWDV